MQERESIIKKELEKLKDEYKDEIVDTRFYNNEENEILDNIFYFIMVSRQYYKHLFNEDFPKKLKIFRMGACPGSFAIDFEDFNIFIQFPPRNETIWVSKSKTEGVALGNWGYGERSLDKLDNVLRFIHAQSKYPYPKLIITNEMRKNNDVVFDRLMKSKSKDHEERVYFDSPKEMYSYYRDKLKDMNSKYDIDIKAFDPDGAFVIKKVKKGE